MKKVLLVDSVDGDWEGFYVDGVLKGENHSLTITEVLDALGIEYNGIELDFEAAGMSSLPTKAEDLPIL